MCLKKDFEAQLKSVNLHNFLSPRQIRKSKQKIVIGMPGSKKGVRSIRTPDEGQFIIDIGGAEHCSVNKPPTTH